MHPISQKQLVGVGRYPQLENADNHTAVSPCICPQRCQVQICETNVVKQPSHRSHRSNSHDRHDPVPRVVPCSGWVATDIEGRETTTAHQLGPILQLNVDGFTADKKQVVEQLARNNKVIAILLQNILYQSWCPCNRRLLTLRIHQQQAS